MESNTGELDRRVRRTRRRLKEAIGELINERDYGALTVQDIADRADVGRSTFYVHFESKEDLLFACVPRHLLALVEHAPDRMTPEQDARRFRFSLPLLLHMRLQKRLFLASILGGAGGRLKDVSVGMFKEMVDVELDRLSPELGSDPKSFPGATSEEIRSGLSRATVGTFLGLVDWWLRCADHLPAEAVDEVFHRTVMPGIIGRP
jgi:AcrR family transcriptional regulator